MIYKLNFKLVDIRNNCRDPRELHFRIENTNQNVEDLLRSGFMFILSGKWGVSANNGNMVPAVTWYIRGQQIERQRKRYYNETKKKYCYKNEFNKELIRKHPSIENDCHKGEFNTETKIMKIL